MPQLLACVKALGGIVQEHELEIRNGHSVAAVMGKIMR